MREQDRVGGILALVASEPPAEGGSGGVPGLLERLCAVALRLLPVTGVCVSLMTGEGVQGVTARTNQLSGRLAELQFTLGEGPSIDAFAWQRPVLVADLADGGLVRWPTYAPAAYDSGVRAVFAFPMQVGAARLGAVEVVRDRPEGLSGAALSDGLAVAATAVHLLLDGQAEAQSGRAAGGVGEAMNNQPEVHQASGMLRVQLGIPIADALALLRARAYVDDRPVAEVAHEVLTGALQLDEAEPE